MPEVTITIGGRPFEVACQEGEEHFLISAAKLLDDEAQVLADQVGRMPEARMLLMAGLMLADKTANLEDQVAKLKQAQAEIIAPERIEVPVIPPAVTETLAELAARAESLAAKVEEKARN